MILKNGYIIINNELVRKDIKIEGSIIEKISDNIESNDFIDLSECE